jgi:hypothetical protein
MNAVTRLLRFVLPLTVATVAAAQAPGPPLPEDHRRLATTISFAQMQAFLAGVDGKGPVRVSVEGTTAGGRPLYLVHLGHGGTPGWKVLLYAQQHGDEVSGKDALLYLVRDVARRPELLPRDVELWVMPMMNPDGAEAGTRENASGADLNRDHMVLEQPETQALHRVARRLRPDVAVDLHEFGRESESYQQRGWQKWPDITMDSLDNPLFGRRLVAAALRWVDEGATLEAETGHRFLRYWVGGAPPDEEQRHSAPDIDGGLNGIGMYRGLSFIVEVAARDPKRDPTVDLGKRVDAALALLWRFVRGDRHRQHDLAAIAESRRRPLPAFIPVNYFWANPEATVTEFPVVETATGRVVRVPTANMMTEMVVKRTVPTPLGYAVEPRAAADYRSLLERHGIPGEMVATPRRVKAERCTLERVEEEFDEVYSRYEGRQIVKRDEAREVELAPGSLWVPLEGESALRGALVLEPAMLYGLYQYPRFRALVGPDGSLPILRVVR